jgi:hypothetical protein
MRELVSDPISPKSNSLSGPLSTDIASDAIDIVSVPLTDSETRTERTVYSTLAFLSGHFSRGTDCLIPFYVGLSD